MIAFILALFIQQAEPPNIPCHIGDTFNFHGEVWNCASEGTIIPPEWHRWRKHSDAPLTVGFSPDDVIGLGEWIEQHCHIVSPESMTFNACTACAPPQPRIVCKK